MPPDDSSGSGGSSLSLDDSSGGSFEGRAAVTVVVARTGRRAARSGALWGIVFGGYVAASASGYASLYPTPAARTKLAASFGANAGLAALVGTARRLDTVAGFTAWRSLGVLSVVGAVWGLFSATRLLRGEEDAGRWELYLVGQTTRGRAATQALVGLLAGLGALWVVTALIVVVEGSMSTVRFSVSGSLFLAVSLVAGAAMFMSVGALIAELAANRRSANGIGAAVLGASFLIRMVADSSSGLAWLRWGSPLGWCEELRPLTGSRPLALVPVVIVVVAASGAAVAIAGRRDVGAGLLGGNDAPESSTALLSGPSTLAIRLLRPVAIGWFAGLAVLGVVIGLVAQSAAAAISGSASVAAAVDRLGGHRSGAAAYLGIALLSAAALVAFAAAAQIATTWGEESAGRVDNLFVQPMSRRRWLAGRLAGAAGMVTAASVITGVATWVGAATQNSGVGLGQLVAAGLNIAPPALFVLGAGALVYGLRPRMAPAFTFGLVAWSLLVELGAAVIKANQWLLDTSVLTHMTPAPAADPNWSAAATLVALGLLAAGAGVALFERRDLAAA
jgi:ABC-2 type transport system permease protein